MKRGGSSCFGGIRQLVSESKSIHFEDVKCVLQGLQQKTRLSSLSHREAKSNPENFFFDGTIFGDCTLFESEINYRIEKISKPKRTVKRSEI